MKKFTKQLLPLLAIVATVSPAIATAADVSGLVFPPANALDSIDSPAKNTYVFPPQKSSQTNINGSRQAPVYQFNRSNSQQQYSASHSVPRPAYGSYGRYPQQVLPRTMPRAMPRTVPSATPGTMMPGQAYPGKAYSRQAYPNSRRYKQYPTYPYRRQNARFPFSNNMMPFSNGLNNNFFPFSSGSNMPFFGMPTNPMYGNPMNNMFGNNRNGNMPFFKQSKKKRKKAWGTERNIWPDFYTDFTDEAWDTAMGGPRDLGRMPGGWRFPYISTPDPVTVSDAIVNQFPPIAEEAGNMADFSDWGVFDNK